MDKVTEEKRVRAFGRGQENVKKFDIKKALMESGVCFDDGPDRM